jgi:hypothetical protein
MKLTKSGLKRIIQEELQQILQEGEYEDLLAQIDPERLAAAEAAGAQAKADRHRRLGLGAKQGYVDADYRFIHTDRHPKQKLYPATDVGPNPVLHTRARRAEDVADSAAPTYVAYGDPASETVMDLGAMAHPDIGRSMQDWYAKKMGVDPAKLTPWMRQMMSQPSTMATTVTKEHLTRIIDEVLKKLV